MNLDQRQRFLGLVAIGVLGLLVADRLVVTPLTRAWSDRNARIATLKKSVARGAFLLDRDSRIRTDWAQMRTNALAAQTSTAESQLLRAFDNWSRESGANVGSLRPQWKRSPEDHVTLECRADVSGDLAALARFLYQAEKDPLAIRVESVEIATRDNNGEQLTMGLQVSGLQLGSTTQ